MMSVFINVSEHILYEDDYVLAVSKPASLMVEPDRNGYPNLLQQVRSYLKALSPGKEIYAQHIHRLDRPVSGVVLFAKQREVLRNLSEQFAQRSVKKYYRALTEHKPVHAQAILTNWIRKEKKKAIIYDTEIEFSERAILEYELLKQLNDLFLWNIKLHTGKYHQIRAQLAHIGCPITGDADYGSKIIYQPNAIALHAYKLIFKHPVNDAEICIEDEFIFS